ncbi:GspJ family T2SS minor pseudopilin variant LspJ [Legionella sp. CNM-4043-24]|uniref:GspJ family T2SS minor pseudopilin variant LspJ n=1 Tax=Legionella sp. CNM-4043-24 TaxID=3421646 RepID=UPI00403A810D
MRQSQTGFTLIEILVALAVFGILAAITSSTMYYAFTTRTRVTEQAEYIVKLELAITLMERDAQQAVIRPVRGNDMGVFPIFVGQSGYTEFTRGGLVNPGGEEKRSTMKRVAYLCANNKLIRRSWPSLDTTDRGQYMDTVLLSRLKACRFAYLNKNQDVLPEWRHGQADPRADDEPLPKAIQLSLTLESWGELNLLFILSRALYVSNVRE